MADHERIRVLFCDHLTSHGESTFLGPSPSPARPGTASASTRWTTSAPARRTGLGHGRGSAGHGGGVRPLRPASLAGYWANWGYDHRGVAVRIPGERGSATRIEHCLGDGAANPCVVAAMVLQAARLGVENACALPPAETGDGLETVDTEVCVPENLGAALDALERDNARVSAVGELLVGNFVGIKRKAWDDWLGATTDRELAQYLNFI